MLFALKLVNNVAYLECRAQLQAQVLHHHIRAEEQQCFAVNLVCSEGLHVNGETGVHDGDVGNRILNAPVPGVPGLLLYLEYRRGLCNSLLLWLLLMLW